MLALAALLATQTPPADASAASNDALLPTRLIYVPGVFAAKCPSPADVQSRIVEDLGANPFVEPAQRYALLVVEGEHTETADTPLRARAELLDEQYGSLGERVIEGHGDSCEELVGAATLALAIALDPSRALAPPPIEVLPPPPPAPLPAPAPLEREAPPPARVIVSDTASPPDALTAALPEGTRAVFGVGGQGGLLLTPGFNWGSHVSAAWRGSWWGLGLELRNDIPRSDPTGALLLSAVPCAHLGLVDLREGDALGVRACATSTAGFAWSLGQQLGGGPYLGLGARLGGEWVMRDASAVGVWAQVEFAPLRPTFVDTTTATPQQGPPVNVTLGATWELGWPI